MSWIHAFLELNKSLFLKGLLLLMAFLLGLQMGKSRLQRQWDAEKQTVQIAQAKQEQHAADMARVQNQISKEVSDDYGKKSVVLADRFFKSERMLDEYEVSSGNLSEFSSNAARAASASSNNVFTSEGVSAIESCEQLSKDASQTTLMLFEIQSWYQKQAAIAH